MAAEENAFGAWKALAFIIIFSEWWCCCPNMTAVFDVDAGRNDMLGPC